MLRIGPHHVDPPVVLAPMAGITDAPFRVLCAEHGGGLYVSEMVTSRGLVERNATSWEMVRRHALEPVASLQLYGADPRAMSEAVRMLVDAGAVDHIDLNFGCPVPKITRNGGGAALPVRPRLLGEVIGAAVTAAGDVPVTVKMRKGLDDERVTYLDAARIAVERGAAAIALHARTAAQGYSGVADRTAIRRLVEAVDGAVPVLGNGDIWAAGDAVSMLAETGCDGVVIGRGCLGRPWLFADLARAMAGEEPLGPPLLGAVADAARRHLELALGWEPTERTAVQKLRKHLRWYLQGYPVGSELRKRAGLVSTPQEVLGVLDDVDPDAACDVLSIAAPRGKTAPTSRIVLPEGWTDADDPAVDARAGAAEEVLARSGG